MKNYLLILLILILFNSCRKIDLDKTESQLLGKWQLSEFLIDGKDELNTFKSDIYYFDYLIFYPKEQGSVVYCHNINSNQTQGIWQLNTTNNGQGVGEKLMLSLIEQGDLYQLFTKPKFFLYNNQWSVQKLNNNKLIIEILTPKRYKLSFTKIGKF